MTPWSLVPAAWLPDLTHLLNLILGVGLLFAGSVLMVLEFIFPSAGILTVAAVGCAVAAVALAFQAGAFWGWVFVVLIPVFGIAALRIGLLRLRRSRLVAQDPIVGNAGYHHYVERLGIEPGSEGVLVTHARPTGRARFPGGECDIQVKGQPLDAGAPVVVRQIAGATVFVVAATSRTE
ncbi:MAG: hypothetical protein ACOCYN_01955 [Planctomycetota bacterium]